MEAMKNMNKQPLTVGQLITALKAFPEDLQVLGEGEENWFYNFVEAERVLVREGRVVPDRGGLVVALRRY